MHISLTLTVGIWNSYAKRNEDWDTSEEVRDMFEVPYLKTRTIDGRNFGKLGIDLRQKNEAGSSTNNRLNNLFFASDD